jgi:cation diffusion facilitator CzcD-associated flavoprotein CzcO
MRYLDYVLMSIRLRKQGLKVKIFEKGAASGGIWYWNCYPGARVDSDTPIYQLFDKELWEGFTFKERYAGSQELRRYFDYVEEKWDLKKDISYNKMVEGATFDEKSHKWLVECSDGSQALCKYFIPCIGFASRRFTPPFKGLSDFKGDVYHTAVWPQHGVNFKGKRVAQIGTGASGIQCIQEIGPKAKHLTIYQRTPNFCLPMNQRKLDPKEEEERKKSGEYEKAFDQCYKTFAGFTYDFLEKNTFDDTPEEREKVYHNLMVEQGGFRFWLNTYKDMLYSQEANDEAYEFWKKTVRKRIPDPKKAELLAPTKAPHPWGTKRPSLEQNFYEVMSQDNVDLIDINTDKILEITEKGVRTESGVVEVDILVLATGFDSVTGSLAQLNIQGTGGGTIADHWANGTKTSMGIVSFSIHNLQASHSNPNRQCTSSPTCFSSTDHKRQQHLQMALHARLCKQTGSTGRSGILRRTRSHALRPRKHPKRTGAAGWLRNGMPVCSPRRSPGTKVPTFLAGRSSLSTGKLNTTTPCRPSCIVLIIPLQGRRYSSVCPVA